MNRILIISPLPPYATLLKALYVKPLIHAGFAVEFWNVAPFTWGAEHAALHGEPAMEQRVFQTPEELRAALDSFDRADTLCIVQAWAEARFYPAYEAVLEGQFTTGIFFCWDMEEGNYYSTRPMTLFFKHLRLMRKRISTLLRGKSRRSGPPAPDLFFCMGESLMHDIFLDRTLVPVNHLDYEQFLQTCSDPPHPQSVGACVFLDIALTMHPDIPLICGADFATSTEAANYFQAMCKLFDLIERDLGLPVIIAAHPKAHYSGDEFGGRPIIQGHTPACVRGARMAVSHTSTASVMAPMWKIPILFATGKIVTEAHGNTDIVTPMAQMFGAPIIDIDALPVQISMPTVNTQAYTKLLDKYTWPQYKKASCVPDLVQFIKKYKPGLPKNRPLPRVAEHGK